MEILVWMALGFVLTFVYLTATRNNPESSYLSYEIEKLKMINEIDENWTSEDEEKAIREYEKIHEYEVPRNKCCEQSIGLDLIIGRFIEMDYDFQNMTKHVKNINYIGGYLPGQYCNSIYCQREL